MRDACGLRAGKCARGSYMLKKILEFGHMVRFSHSLFAMPFAIGTNRKTEFLTERVRTAPRGAVVINARAEFDKAYILAFDIYYSAVFCLLRLDLETADTHFREDIGNVFLG